MRSLLLNSSVLLAFALACAGTETGQLHVQNPDTKAAADEVPDPERLFVRGCQACHQPPDPRFAVDRAWLTQVHDTA